MRTVKWFTVGDVAQRLGVSGDAVRLWDRLGRLKAIRTHSGMRLFAEKDVLEFERQRREQRAASD